MKCFNWKVIAALAGVGLALYAFAPGVATAALPLLVVAACPLSMLLMMRMMGGSTRSCETKGDDEVARLRAEVAELRGQSTPAGDERQRSR